MKFILLLLIVNSVSAQQNFSSFNGNPITSTFENSNSINTSKKMFTDIRLSLGGGIGILYGNKFSSLNIQSLLNKDFTITMGLDYYFIKDKEEKQLKNFLSPTLLIVYNVGADKLGNELSIGGGLSYHDFNKFKPLISVKGNLYLKNNFYLGLEIRQPFLDPVLESTGIGLFATTYIGVNLFYQLTN